MPVASPCVDICAIDPVTGWCTGCLRTLDEIAAWGVLDESEQRAVLGVLPARRRTVQASLEPKDAP